MIDPTSSAMAAVGAAPRMASEKRRYVKTSPWGFGDTACGYKPETPKAKEPYKPFPSDPDSLVPTALGAYLLFGLGD